ncbi:MAG: quinone-dependent dihydroorotate dehydrogenase [Planctomycetota bacterium]
MLDLLWKSLARPLFFQLPPESAHYFAMNTFATCLRVPGARALTEACFSVSSEKLTQQLFGLHFANPVGLAAGFDKDARWIRALGALGFAAIEVGSVTGQGQPGNPQPRLFRLPADQALINRMGFNNAGARQIRLRLERTPLTHFRQSHVLGINLGKTKVVPLEDAASDYLASFKLLFPFGDYFVVNVSSPNTPGLRTLQDKAPLTKILQALQQANQELAAEASCPARPLLLKIAPDLTEHQLLEIVELARECQLAGLIATNTTLDRSHLRTSAEQVEKIGAGGLSGAPLRARSLEVVRLLYSQLRGEIPIIGVGGIFSGEDAWKMISAGACLIQTYTGFVYTGPGIAAGINRYLIRQLEQHHLGNIAQAVGRDC